MTLCKTHNGAQCTCQPDEGVPCEFEKTKTILQIADEEGALQSVVCPGYYLFSPCVIERFAARIRADELERILNYYEFSKSPVLQWLSDAIRNSKE